MSEPEKIKGTSRRSRGWRFWLFVGVNVLGVVVAIPLLQAVFPLISIWWNTRTQESFRRHEAALARPSATVPVATPESTGGPATTSPASEKPSLDGLTNNLNLIGHLNDSEIDKIVAHQFGKAKTSQSDPAKFDSDSAVFHKITRSMETINGVRYFSYEVDLVDENGNHKVHVDYFEQPDLDYERSMAALELMNSNPQLKKIYKAFARVLAEKSASPEPAEVSSPHPKPVLRLEKERDPAQP